MLGAGHGGTCCGFLWGTPWWNSLQASSGALQGSSVGLPVGGLPWGRGLAMSKQRCRSTKSALQQYLALRKWLGPGCPTCLSLAVADKVYNCICVLVLFVGISKLTAEAANTSQRLLERNPLLSYIGQGLGTSQCISSWLCKLHAEAWIRTSTIMHSSSTSLSAYPFSRIQAPQHGHDSLHVKGVAVLDWDDLGSLESSEYVGKLMIFGSTVTCCQGV